MVTWAMLVNRRVSGSQEISLAGETVEQLRINNYHNNRAEERAPPTEKAFQGRVHLKTDVKETKNIQKETDIDRNLHKLIPFYTILLTMTILSAKTFIQIIIL